MDKLDSRRTTVSVGQYDVRGNDNEYGGNYDSFFYQRVGDIVKRGAYDVADIFAFPIGHNGGH